MSEKVRKLKENASRLIAKGRLGEAADEYVKIVKADPRDLTARQKLAEIYARMGKVPEAVAEYQSVAGSYAADGLLLKAIAVCKIILQIDPAHKETQTILADLSTRRRGEATAVEMPKAMSSALSSGKRSASEIRGVPAGQLRPRTGEIANVAQAAAAPPGFHAPGASIPLGAGPMQPQVFNEVPQPPPRQTANGPALGASLATQLPVPPSGADDAARALMAAFDAAPGPVADMSTAGAARAPADDFAIEVSVDGVEGAPVVVGQSALGVSDASIGAGAPIELTPMMMKHPNASANAMSADIFAPSSEPVVVGVASTEGAAVSLPTLSAEPVHVGQPVAQAQLNDLPPDEVIEDDAQDASDIIELTEPARVEIDKVPPIPLFSDLPQAAFIALTERMDLRVAATGDVLVQEGERGTSMFIIIQGRVVVKRRALAGTGVDEGSDIALAELTDGAFFGEMALLSDAPRMASVVCADDTMLFEISRDLLADMTREYPSVGEVMKRFHKNRLLTNLLKTSPIFAPFSTKDKKELIEKFKSRAVDEGTYLITRERPGEGLYVVLSGRCEVFDVNPEGKEVLLAELKEGDVFGEMSMLWHKKTCASVKAVTPCVVLRLPRDNFNEVIMTHPQILETLTALSERRQKQNQELRAPEVVSDFLV